jgi:hypothetical protein
MRGTFRRHARRGLCLISRDGCPVFEGPLGKVERATLRPLDRFSSGFGGRCSPAAFASIEGYACQSQDAGVIHQLAASPGAFLGAGNVMFAPGRRLFSRSVRFLDWHDLNSSLQRRLKQFEVAAIESCGRKRQHRIDVNADL